MDFFKVVKPSRVVFPLACLAVVAMVVISEGSYWQSVGTLNELGTMGAAGTSIQDLQLSLMDAESRAARLFVDPPQRVPSIL